MKTILYQPLFINPQAYFVFPQLYHIEKGDSYIEPANITGQLIINDLTKVLTSTVYQTKNKYNEQTIYPDDKQDTDTLFIGNIRKNVSGAVKLDFLNMEEVANFAGTIKFTNVV